ncbi:hypothetical protein [Dyadobacter sp. BHUBP1]|uniref:hypothetical protein n=1 Tax=Dyadobacter sp. BHUBP1 TaxID=3424178 RepID=UPI003D329049
MKDQKSVKTRRSYDAEFKQEMIRVLFSGRSAREISEGFGIAEKRSAAAGCLSLERMVTKKTKTNSGENGNDKPAKLAAELLSSVRKMNA